MELNWFHEIWHPSVKTDGNGCFKHKAFIVVQPVAITYKN